MRVYIEKHDIWPDYKEGSEKVDIEVEIPEELWKKYQAARQTYLDLRDEVEKYYDKANRL